MFRLGFSCSADHSPSPQGPVSAWGADIQPRESTIQTRRTRDRLLQAMQLLVVSSIAATHTAVPPFSNSTAEFEFAQYFLRRCFRCSLRCHWIDTTEGTSNVFRVPRPPGNTQSTLAVVCMLLKNCVCVCSSAARKQSMRVSA